MTTLNVCRRASALMIAAAMFSASAFASASSVTPSCGGDKSGEVKKPNGDDKRPTNPSTLCGGDKSGEVKKPNGDDKRPTNPS